MAYELLIRAIFSPAEAPPVVSEDAFVDLLPGMLSGAQYPGQRWTGAAKARLIILRFGLLGERQHTLKECGDEFGISAPRARQIETKAMLLLRLPESVLRCTVKPSNAEVSGAGTASAVMRG